MKSNDLFNYLRYIPSEALEVRLRTSQRSLQTLQKMIEYENEEDDGQYKNASSEKKIFYKVMILKNLDSRKEGLLNVQAIEDMKSLLNTRS